MVTVTYAGGRTVSFRLRSSQGSYAELWDQSYRDTMHIVKVEVS